jgi:multiple sugar transport system permease protein
LGLSARETSGAKAKVPSGGILALLDRRIHLVFPIPAVVTILLIIAFPLAYTCWLSLHKWVVSTFSVPTFVGGGNYFRLLGGDLDFWASVLRTLQFTFLALLLQTLIGLGMALIFDREFPGRGLARTLMLLPMTATPAAIGLLWTMMMDPDLGVLNYFLSLVGLPKSLWLASPQLVIPAVVLVDTWEWGPLIALFCMAGLAVIPTEPYEAARIDGASGWQQFRFITLPLLRPILVVAILFRTIDALKTFDILYVMTQGGPARASETINILAYLQAFHYFNMGYSSSILVVLMALVLGISLMLISVRRGSTP